MSARRRVTAGGRLAGLEEIPDGGARGVVVASGAADVPIFVVRRGARVHAYENSCPHLGTPLDWALDEFFDRAGRQLVCATHGALFRVEDGVCVAGPCRGDRLEPWPVHVRDGAVWDGAAAEAGGEPPFTSSGENRRIGRNVPHSIG